MRDYMELVEALREHSKKDSDCELCPYNDAEDRGYTTCSEELTSNAADAIEELSKPKWISVEDRCPEKYGDYLVFDDCRNLYVNEWHCLLHKWQYDDGRITHWTQLPEPPKESTNDSR